MIAKCYKMYPTEPRHADMRTGDDVMANLGELHIDLLKIDVEGTEGDVLHGFQESLANKRVRTIIFEYKGMNHLAGYSLLDLYCFLQERGYMVGRLWPRGVEFNAYDPALEGCSVSYHVAVIREDAGLQSRLSVTRNGC